MAKEAVTDFSTTPASNTDIGGIGIQGSNQRANFDDAFRELMAQLAETNAGTSPWADTMTIGNSGDLTREFRFSAAGISTGTTRILTVPNYDGTLATLAGTETLTNKTLTSPTITGEILTDAISGMILSPANQDYRLVVKIPFAGTITETVTRSSSGTCTATFKVNTTALGGTANAVSTSEVATTQSSSNTFVAGDDIVVTISANASCANMSFTIKYTRAVS